MNKPSPSEADRFRRAAQCVVSVPKGVVDRRAAAEKKKRASARKLARA